MVAALIILAALVGVGALLYALDRLHLKRNPARDDEPAKEPPAQCCGMHITCEKDSLLATVSDKIEYYDDEDLDAYKGRTPDSYTDAETEEFRDVLLTLLPADIAGWGRSLQLRGIALPPAVKEELLLIVSEARTKH